MRDPMVVFIQGPRTESCSTDGVGRQLLSGRYEVLILVPLWNLVLVVPLEGQEKMAGKGRCSLSALLLPLMFFAFFVTV